MEKRKISATIQSVTARAGGNNRFGTQSKQRGVLRLSGLGKGISTG